MDIQRRTAPERKTAAMRRPCIVDDRLYMLPSVGSL
jgi:hypothetical protein